MVSAQDSGSHRSEAPPSPIGPESSKRERFPGTAKSTPEVLCDFPVESKISALNFAFRLSGGGRGSPGAAEDLSGAGRFPAHPESQTAKAERKNIKKTRFISESQRKTKAPLIFS